MLVTGGGQGIGRAFALASAKDSRIVIADRNVQTSNSVVDEIRAAGGVATAIQTDVSDRAGCARMAAHTVREFGRIDVLINSAVVRGSKPMNFWEIGGGVGAEPDPSCLADRMKVQIIKRPGNPEDVVGVALFLASEQSRYMHLERSADGAKSRGATEWHDCGAPSTTVRFANHARDDTHHDRPCFRASWLDSHSGRFSTKVVASTIHA